MEDRELINEFLIESNENLLRLEQEIVDLEQRPHDPELLASIFRTVHTIKGTCGFLDFTNLGAVTHIAENLLSQLRNRERELTPRLTSLILETMDAIRKELAAIEATSKESGETWEDLRRRLTAACNSVEPEATAPAVLPEPAAAAVRSEAAPVEEEKPATNSAGAAGEPEKASTGRAGAIAESTIRVDVGLLDRLMNLVGELVLARNQILQYSSKQDEVTLNGTAQRLNLITTQLQEGVMKTRMQPIGVIWNKLPRVVRDLAATCGKQIQLEMDGSETELDKSIIEAIKDPLTHIVRNCCDHGIERPEVRKQRGKPAQGRLFLRAYHEGGQVNIEIVDDGAGIDGAKVRQKAVDRGLLRSDQAERMSEREAVNLIFLPGLSTAEKITSISGRGVGMDVVKTNIEKTGGVVDLSSRPGMGTTVRIKIPLTLAIIPGLVVSSGGERFIIPQVSLLELLRLEGETGRRQLERVHGTVVYRRRGSLLPVISLNEVLHLPGPAETSEGINIVVLQAEDRQFGLIVDAINDTQEIVVKPLGKQLKGLTSYAGATIMGDGKVALILDILGIGQHSGILAEGRDQARTESDGREASHESLQTFLLFRAGRYERLAVPLALVTRLEEFPRVRIEHAGGRMVIQYRDDILRLVRLGALLNNDGSDPDGSNLSSPEGLPDTVQAVVFAEQGRMIGLIVDQIVDICDESIHAPHPSDRPGLSGSAVIAGKVTDFLDLPAVLRAIDQAWSVGGHARGANRASILIADENAFSRGLIRNYLELAGYSVTEAVDHRDALEKLERRRISAVVMSRSLPAHGGCYLLDQIRRRSELAALPVVAFGAAADSEPSGACGFNASLDRLERAVLLESLANLAEAVSRPAATLGVASGSQAEL